MSIKEDINHLLPDKNGHFGLYGGKYVPETLMAPLEELESAYKTFLKDKKFKSLLKNYMADYIGRATPLYFAEHLTEALGGARIYLKREDLCHTGAHKVNNTIGQILLAKKLNKKKIIAETYEDHKQLVDFYLHRGYKVFHKRLRKGNIVLIMEKNLW